jgi:hypothetical protein
MRVLRRLLLLIGLILFSQGASAQTIMQRLITPGPLSAAHARLEANCEACHVSFSREAQNGKCLGCHRGISADVQRSAGFHGKSSARGQACKACHSDHRGRGFGLVRFSRAGFNHGLTNYPLLGGHTKATCAGCHGNNTHYRGTPTACATCHAKKDPHAGRLGKDCQSCHIVNDWKKALPFDHARTGYALVGKHRGVACLSCHAGQRWNGTPTQCYSCHAKNDVHKGARGTNCANCHNPSDWKSASFDHNRDTGFPLLGKHAGASCAACHGAGNAIRKPSRTCVACHASDDVHKGRNGTDCVRCHNSRDWKDSSFDHDKMTRFALTGAHKPLECAACHKQPAHAVKLPVQCIGCHADDDPHKGKFGSDCASCHNVVAWKDRVAFDHALSRFPLVGKHASVACSACHADKTFAAKGITCQACHADDHHAGTLGAAPSCVNCHNSTDWKLWKFDHDTATHFALTGKHKGLICTACHAKPADPATAPSECVACHRQDDVHKGNFGDNCERCHVTSEFSEIKIK